MYKDGGEHHSEGGGKGSGGGGEKDVAWDKGGGGVRSMVISTDWFWGVLVMD